MSVRIKKTFQKDKDREMRVRIKKAYNTEKERENVRQNPKSLPER